MSRYWPCINASDDSMNTSTVDETRTKSSMRAVAVVAQDTIGHGDELFVDYVEDKRSDMTYTPDWLIQPPEPTLSPYFQKKEMVSQIPLAVRALIYYEQTKKGKTFDEFVGRVSKELPAEEQVPRLEQSKKTVTERLAMMEEARKLENKKEKQQLGE
uniref:SET domain-containing protein n=1 Tax=Strombidium inclinatum TaxID=197538 RepID=A0A7S3IJS8_9SPIT|mmetsp:Transcript_21675/g.33376  ORF Transcript_21675/g.33376 Transcript_21675/m.33376 type:complete len:157 (+) Transcript_21675:973-1443(+)